MEPVDDKVGAFPAPSLSLGRISYNRSLLESKLNYLIAQYSDPLDAIRVALDLANRCGLQGTPPLQPETQSPESAVFATKMMHAEIPLTDYKFSGQEGVAVNQNAGTITEENGTALLETKLRSSNIEQHTLVRINM